VPVPLSGDPDARGRQLANLRRGGHHPNGTQRIEHGAYMRVLDQADLDAAERRVLDALAADAPVRAAGGGLPAADATAVRLLADVCVRLDGVRDFLRRRGLENERGQLRESVLDLERRLRVEAAGHASALGMTPASRLALGLDLARTVDLAQQWAAEAASDDVLDGEVADDR
jgi:hypothetical protein